MWPEVNAMAKQYLDSVLEAFILAAGIPSSVWRTVPDHTTMMAQHKARMRQSSNRGDTPVNHAAQEDNRDECS